MQSIVFTPSQLSEAALPSKLVLPSEIRNRRAALVVAHPGHELRVHGWLELACPVVFILTDGSGHTGQSRLDSTTHLLAQANARPGSIYGRFTDIEVYSAILDHNFRFFERLVDELADALLSGGVEYVVGDAIEGHNPSHDVCRAVVNAAIELASCVKKSRIANLDFKVVGRPDSRSRDFRARAICVELDKPALDRKLAAARSYSELSEEVSKMIDELGIAAFQIEPLLPATGHTHADSIVQEPPFYERYGEKQVAAGYYRRVIRYREHVLPLAGALSDYAQRRTV